MSRYFASRLFPITLLVATGVFAACVGADPVDTAAEKDGGTSSSSSSSGSTSSSGGPGNDGGGGPSTTDGAPPPSCDPSKPFGTLTPFEEVNTDAQDEGELRFSPDGELAYYTRGSFVSGNLTDIWVATRKGGFKDGVPLPGVNTDDGCCFEGFPTVSPNNLEIIFQTNENGVDNRLYRAKRNSTAENFAGRAAIEVLGTAARMPFLTYDGSALYYVDLNDSSKIKRASRLGDGFAAGVLAVPNGTVPMVTADEKTLYFFRSPQVNKATWDDASSKWVEQGAVTELPHKEPSWISADGCTMYFTDVGTLDGGAGTSTGNVWRTSKPK